MSAPYELCHRGCGRRGGMGRATRARSSSSSTSRPVTLTPKSRAAPALCSARTAMPFPPGCGLNVEVGALFAFAVRERLRVYRGGDECAEGGQCG